MANELLARLRALPFPTRLTLPDLQWRRVAAYTGFGLFCFLFFLYLSFPYEAIGARVEELAAQNGFAVKLNGLGPGLFGVSARSMEVSPQAPDGAPATTSLVLQSVSLRPSLSPMGMAVSARAFGGTVKAALGRGAVSASLRDLDVASPELKELTGIDLVGKVSGRLNLSMPQLATPGSQSPQPDTSQASGTLELDLKGLAIQGGTLKFGAMEGMDLPAARAGDIEARLVFDKGTGTLEELSGNGQDLQLKGDGTVKLARALRYSELNLNIKLRADPEFTKRLGLIGSGLSILPPDRDDPSFRVARLSGYLGNPRFAPPR